MPYKIFLIQVFFILRQYFLLGSTLPHMGRVISNGKPFERCFWFALVNDSSQTVWNHGGSAGIPNQSLQKFRFKTDFIKLSWNPEIIGMSPLNSSLFLQYPNLKLRIWFDDGINGIHQLGQDQPLNKALFNRVRIIFRDHSMMDSMSARLQF